LVDIDKRTNDSDADLPTGFKMTELGPLPEEWEVVRLGEVVKKARSGGTPLRSKKEYWNGSIPFALIEDLTASGLYLYRTKESISEEGLRNSSAWIVPEGSILLSMYATIGATAVNKIPLATNQAILALVPTENLNAEFGALLLSYKADELARFNVQSTQKNINKGIVLRFFIPLPPLSEQRAIAHVLRTVQRAKEATERVIQATQELKKSLMYYLFTYGSVPIEEAEKVPLKETEIGLVPEHWEVVKLENCLSLIRNGISKKQNATSKTGYPVTRIETISEDRINPDKVGYIDNLTPTEVEKFRLRPGDILFSHINSEPQIGRSVIYEGWPSTLLHGMNLLLLRTNSNTIPYWLNYLFMHYRAIGIFIKIAARAVNQSSINQSKMKSLPIPLPPLPEQHEIARILQAVDKKLQAEEARKQALEALLKTLLNNLMTGKG